ncbi:hypothetical protein [Cellulomonas fimi]|uniref:Uncharacterized protein n=1 Tax=Cellulomonas fimi (strain ATCC 484 / DSM 20113 / JCM 1341 / CCUG 24087 / LMG 16345 / NBRC 15513 / NCIMB 8980 / NCTC 7547 / NRS-133) TaxID=590998 RepID=F4GY96_CELFA|nr:hypothetical protein [Cellulomonas fimi]AEE45885.1 hypothetical protein Celf_1753 [Cellulomonas fimi ATCC 484]NNH06789.1 hypothetical protein [Cellulomonas fimi]VEH30889.1 Uncharacterised protein [Cellulomonas fimi]
MTNPRTTALGAVTLFTVVLLVTLVASSEALWTSWPGAAVRFGGVLAAASGLYTLAARWDRRAAHH